MWAEISAPLEIRLATFRDVGLAKATPDDKLYEFCQDQGFYLLTDNRNQDDPASLETMIRTRTQVSSLPVFTISDLQRFRSHRNYGHMLVAKLLERFLRCR